jgi:hypothetical protein
MSGGRVHATISPVACDEPSSPEPERVFALSFPEVVSARTGSRPLSLAEFGLVTALLVPPATAALPENEPEVGEALGHAAPRRMRRPLAFTAVVLVLAVCATRTETGAAFLRQATAELPHRAEASIGVVSDCMHVLAHAWSGAELGEGHSR